MLRIELINAISELDRFGWKYTPSGPNEVRCLCPLHEDVNPSLSLNTEKNVWICHASNCKAKGDIISLLAHIGGCERKTILADLLSRYPDLGVVKVINQERVEAYHKAIWSSGPFLQALYKRGVTDEDIRSARLGYHEGRIMIPVYDNQKRVINIRKYLPGAPGPEKMRNVRGYTTKAIYQIDQLKYSVVWILGGEMKALVAKRMLEEHKIGAIAVTAGEGTWDTSFTPLVKSKHIFICMDIDPGGYAATKRLATCIYGVAESVRMIELPLDVNKYPKGDVNDWVGSEGATSEDFLKLMETALEFIPPIITDIDDAELYKCKLKEAARAENIGRPIQCRATIAALDEVVYLVPSVIRVSCGKDQAFCNFCMVRRGTVDQDTGMTIVDIKPTSSALLELINASKRTMKQALLNSLNAPNCKAADVYPAKFSNVLDTRLTAPLELDGDNREHIVQPAYLITDQFLNSNVPYIMQGRPYPHPNTSQAVLLIDQISEVEDSLESCDFTEQDCSDLQIFQPTKWDTDTLNNKLADIYTDFSNNITRIFDRPDLHLAMDLAFHSPLYFLFEKRNQHGWVNCLITGDSSQGKSEVALRLIEHYGLGTRHDCKNASEAGLLGGLQQMGTKWFVTWGVIPIYDKQLVILEEIKGTSPMTLGALTDMRSSGYAQITKIERRKAHARTRLIMISNPRSDRTVSAYNYGVEVIKELMGSNEDVRRFDYALVLSEQEISAERINLAIASNEISDPFYSNELCRKAVLWSWTRSAEQYSFQNQSYQSCMELSQDLCKVYSETVPLCDKGTMRYKLARLAASLANRTFSVEKDTVIVRPCHVEAVYLFLRRIYDSPYCGYGAFSEAEEYSSKLKDEELIIKQIKSTKYPRDFVEQLLHSESIVLNDICDWCEVPRDLGQRILSLFVRKRALFREGLQYVKSSGFIDLLKNLLREGIENTETTSGEEF